MTNPGDVFSIYDPPARPVRAPRRPDDELPILMRWERLRIVYNLALAAEVVLLMAPRLGGGLVAPSFLGQMVICAIGANLCFCAGPIANAYAHWLGLRHAAVTALLFLAGTGLALLLALAMLVPIPGLP